MMREGYPNWLFFSFACIVIIFVTYWLDTYWTLPLILVAADLYLFGMSDFFLRNHLSPILYKTVRLISAYLLIPLLLAVFVQLFLFDMAVVPTNSMSTTVNPGDHVFFTKLIPGTRNALASPIKRYPGIAPVRRGDVLIVNHPETDSVLLDRVAVNYYAYKRANGELANSEVIKLPLHERKRIVKRLLGLPGDTLLCRQGELSVNGQVVDYTKKINYLIYTDGGDVSDSTLKNAAISFGAYQRGAMSNFEFILALSEKQKEILLCDPHVKFVTRMEYPLKLSQTHLTFPYDSHFIWNIDNYGPIIVPGNNKCIKLTPSNLALYRRIIDVYEENDLVLHDNWIYINGIRTDQYCFEKDYYWVQGDNWHQSEDSRYFGFVPEDHVIGKVLTVFLRAH